MSHFAINHETNIYTFLQNHKMTFVHEGVLKIIYPRNIDKNYFYHKKKWETKSKF